MYSLSAKKVGDYLLVLTLVTLSILDAKAEALRPKLFLNDIKNTVLEIVREGKKVYVIHATYSDENLISTTAYRNVKLNLYTRYALLKHLTKKYKGITNFQLNGIQTLESSKSGNIYYQISQLPISNVTPLLSPHSSPSTLSSDILANSIKKEINELELKVKANPNSTDCWKNLYNLYFTTGDLNKADFAMDNVIFLEFEK